MFGTELLILSPAIFPFSHHPARMLTTRVMVNIDQYAFCVLQVSLRFTTLALSGRNCALIFCFCYCFTTGVGRKGVLSRVAKTPSSACCCRVTPSVAAAGASGTLGASGVGPRATGGGG